jgi:hypothetical protein
VLAAASHARTLLAAGRFKSRGTTRPLPLIRRPRSPKRCTDSACTRNRCTKTGIMTGATTRGCPSCADCLACPRPTPATAPDRARRPGDSATGDAEQQSGPLPADRQGAMELGAWERAGRGRSMDRRGTACTSDADSVVPGAVVVLNHEAPHSCACRLQRKKRSGDGGVVFPAPGRRGRASDQAPDGALCNRWVGRCSPGYLISHRHVTSTTQATNGVQHASRRQQVGEIALPARLSWRCARAGSRAGPDSR